MNAAMDLTPYKQLIRQRYGLQFENHAEVTLSHAVEQRRCAVGLDTAGHYYARLLADEAELQELVDLLTVNETYFYREANHLELIVDHLLPRLRAAYGDQRPLRILSAGCSSGEEPYSVAIALQERYGDAAARQFQILGGDVDTRALDKARHATYGEFSFRALSGELRARYFEPAGPRQWRLAAALRERVRLFRYNVLADVPPAELAAPVDIILFRNVSIYFDRPTREAIVARLVQRLAPRGHLIVGNTETFANDFGLLPQCSRHGSFFFSLDPELAPTRPPAGRAEALPPLPLAAAPTATPVALAAASSPPPPEPAPMPVPAALDRARALFEAKRYRDALAVAEALVAEGRDRVEAQTIAAHAHYQLQDHAAARRLAAAVLEQDPWHLDALLLQGNVARQAGQWEEAAHPYKQALYQHPECWPARYLLAECRRRQGQGEGARREYRILLRQVAGELPDSGLRYFRLHAAAAELRRVIEHHLARLDDTRGVAGGA